LIIVKDLATHAGENPGNNAEDTLPFAGMQYVNPLIPRLQQEARTISRNGT